MSDSRGYTIVRYQGRTHFAYGHYSGPHMFNQVIRGVLSSPTGMSGAFGIGGRAVHAWFPNEFWCAGATALDIDARRLVFFGWDGSFSRGRHLEKPWLRRAIVEFLQAFHARHAAEVWSIAWADEGIATIADLAGVPRSEVLGDRWPTSVLGHSREDILQRSGKGFSSTVLTVRDEGGLVRDITLGESGLDALKFGEDILRDLRELPALEALPNEQFVSRGAFIDVLERTIWVWSGNAQEYASRIARAWPGWTAKHAPGMYREQVQRSGREVKPIEVPREIVERELLAYLPKLKPEVCYANAGMRMGSCGCGYLWSYDDDPWAKDADIVPEFGPNDPRVAKYLTRILHDQPYCTGYSAPDPAKGWRCIPGPHRDCSRDGEKLAAKVSEWRAEVEESLIELAERDRLAESQRSGKA